MDPQLKWWKRVNYFLIFLFTFLSGLAERIWGIRFTDNPWVDAVLWGLLFAGILKLIDWVRRK